MRREHKKGRRKTAQIRRLKKQEGRWAMRNNDELEEREKKCKKEGKRGIGRIKKSKI